MERKFKLITEYLDSGSYSLARELIYFELQNPKNNIFIQSKLYGFLIDLGRESRTLDDVKQGINFLEENETELKKYITYSSYCYNLANAIGYCNYDFCENNPEIHSLEICGTNFQKPIDLYWSAYNTTKDIDVLKLKISINLANSLTYNFRYIEAIQILDGVLKIDPNFPEAIISKADHLFMYGVILKSCQSTPSLLAEIYLLYEKALKINTLPIHIETACKEKIQHVVRLLNNDNFSIDRTIKEIEISKLEFKSHSHYRKFSLNNYLTLNEHSIFCNCIESSLDDLYIGFDGVIIKNDIIPKLELLLNRIKSEFGLVRYNYYKSQCDIEEVFNDDIIFYKHNNNEVTDFSSELLRSSFRTCYGILDKIALGICKLYDINNGVIYFERFWNDKDKKQILASKKNIHLNALYSIACDLNTKTGELKHFKNWRNKLEHNLLILVNGKSKRNIIEEDDFLVTVDLNEFQQKTIHLLQITRAAIITFSFLIHSEIIETLKNN
ncbi:LA2681 family HEPN domain-containing protein [Myroides odoratimimus]|uniref:LA2681 family HEPN domain-containing protein n=1 Tax=Myroides odoratimimus TaxID=76832 RepID=UPI0025765A69|nr:LA2681 family HEPN domain-containing protein [Myroides odoratimimus]MDM1085778.1 hypothetical protein [Myroides odoratimimus]